MKTATFWETLKGQTTKVRLHDKQWDLVAHALQTHVKKHPKLDKEAAQIVRTVRIEMATALMGYGI